MSKKILVAEDEPALLTSIVDTLQQQGYTVETATNGVIALEKYRSFKPDLILLDVNMPEKSGYDVCREIRSENPAMPVYMLTARGQEVDKVVGLEIGADDYIVKPFGVDELLARIRVAFRDRTPKKQKLNNDPITFGDVTIDPKTLTGKKNNTTFQVTQREVHILQIFMKNDGLIVSRDTLFDEVWGTEYHGTTRTLDQHIAQLRKKIENKPSEPRYIVTVHGVGYQFFSNP